MRFNLNQYAFTCIALLLSVCGTARADIVAAQWSFQGAAISATGATFGPIAADSGSAVASGVHTSASTAWSSPAGNGSTQSFSSNNWAFSSINGAGLATGSYYQFSGIDTTGLPTVAFPVLNLTFDQTSSGTGPGQFQIQYSIDGGSTFNLISDNPNYSVPHKCSSEPSLECDDPIPRLPANSRASGRRS